MNQYYEFYFKLAYTCETRYYEVNADMSITDFISDIKNRARTDFEIQLDEDIEIVEAGQNSLNGQAAEMAPELEPSSATIREIYGNKYNLTAFYIRKFPRIPRMFNQPENPPAIPTAQPNQNNDENI
jgi:hypothetical protein